MTKFGNKKTTIDGITFDSRHEAYRYAELKLMERTGLIHELQLQVPFELIPKQMDGKRVAERAVIYKADFVYQIPEENGESHIVVEDAKGVKTKEYILKRKLMRWIHGIEIKEV